MFDSKCFVCDKDSEREKKSIARDISLAFLGVSMKKNAGFSLVEVIVVIVIIGIAATSVGIGFSQINKLNVNEGLSALSSCLDTARYKAMSSNSDFYICTDGEYYYGYYTNDEKSEKLFVTNFNLTLEDKSGNVQTVTKEDVMSDFIDSDLKPLVKISFDRMTGRLKEVSTKQGVFVNDYLKIYTENSMILKITNNGRVESE